MRERALVAICVCLLVGCNAEVRALPAPEPARYVPEVQWRVERPVLRTSRGVRARRAVRTLVPRVRSAPRSVGGWRTGVASWYGTLPTGGCYDDAGHHAWTGLTLFAAHRTLPCGTQIRVCLDRGSPCVDVVVADRGPRSRARELDLSREAFRRLAPLSAGLAVIRWRRM